MIESLHDKNNSSTSGQFYSVLPRVDIGKYLTIIL